MIDTEKMLDLKYQRIREIEKKIRLHQEAVAMLKETGFPADVMKKHAKKHAQAVRKLRIELDGLRREQMDDFMHVESIEGLRILNMRYIENLSWDQAAELTGTSRRWLMKIRDRALSEIVSAKEDTKSSHQSACNLLEDSGEGR